MSVAVAAEPRVVHAVPGRARVHLPEWPVAQRGLESRLRRVKGVLSARANVLTSNVLIQFDPALTDLHAVLDALRSVCSDVAALEEDDPAPPPALHEREGEIGRARIAVRGMDRNPAMAQHVVDELKNRPGVLRVSASALTGRVLVEFSRRDTDVEDMLAEVARIELPPLPGEDRPIHPLDPGPLIQSAARTAGAAAGLSVLGAYRLTGATEPPGLRAGAGRIAAVVSILQGFPIIRNSLRRVLGRNVAEMALAVPGIVALTLAGSPLGLTLTLAESARLLTEVIARRSAWKRYEAQLAGLPSAHPGDVIRLDTGERTPLSCAVIEGFGTAVGRHGLPEPVEPGAKLSAGCRLYGGPFVVHLGAHESFEPQPRPAPVTPNLYSRYQRILGMASFGYAALTAVVTRSLGRTFQALLLVNPRTALIGAEGADLSASARVLRGGVTVIGTRRNRPIRLPRYLLLDNPRILTDGFEVTTVAPLDDSSTADEIFAHAEALAAACGAPWGGAIATAGAIPAENASFDGRAASADIGGVRYTLGPPSDQTKLPSGLRLRHQGEHLLVLSREGRAQGVVVLRPRLAHGVTELVETCRRRGVELGVIGAGNETAAHRVGRRCGVTVVGDVDEVEAIRARQLDGSLVYYASDSAHAAAAFDACDLAIGMSSGRGSRFPARADLLAPDLAALAGIVEAGARRDATVRDSVALSVAANLFGAVWGLRSEVGVLRASLGVYITGLGALTDDWMRLRGGERSVLSIARLVDPHPERWGRRGVEEVLRALKTSPEGLTYDEAARRREPRPRTYARSGLLSAVIAQLKSPLTAVLAAGAALSAVLGSVADVVMIGATIAANIVVGAWQERRTGQAIAALERIGTTTARVLRDGQTVVVPTDQIVTGDVLVLAPGDRVAADARLISAQGLEVDEAALTGESLPVLKAPVGGTDASRIVLAGSDVTVGTAHAAVVAVGARTRIGATAAALALDETSASPLGVRLNRMLRQVLPLAAIGGTLVFLSGFLRRRPLVPQLAIGASIGIAAVPEGLPLLAGVGEAAVARRLVGHNALVRRLSAVEALGRVDVACTDKTGTLTEGRLALTAVASLDEEARPSEGLSPELRRVLLAGGLATPHPDAADAAAHPTDVAVMEGARAADLGHDLRVERDNELSFDPTRSFHAALVGGALHLKGAVEALLPRCDRVRRDGRVQPLKDAGRQALEGRAEDLASRGLRVLMVAEGSAETALAEPEGLVALGFLGISDPLRPEVPEAVRRCHEAGIRVVMLTGDHPTTARAIGREAGLLGDGDHILTGAEIGELQNGELDGALDGATVIARVTPLDKLRIVESLQRRGHTVAMTGDGVNDGPALRLADVGVAMGRAGTEVARQAADVVLADDDFSSLVEALVEGRSFWRNIRRAVALLLGGNLGELGLVVGASAMGLASPLLTRQILAVNLVTDVLPSLAVALQPPEHRHLARLAREGTAALDAPLANEVRRRGVATAAPSLAAFLLSLRSLGLPQARSVAFASIVTTQLAQTLDNGRSEGALTRSVLGAVAGSAAVLGLALTTPPLSTFLGLTAPAPFGWLLIGAASLAAVVLGRGLSSLRLTLPARSLGMPPAPAVP